MRSQQTILLLVILSLVRPAAAQLESSTSLSSADLMLGIGSGQTTVSLSYHYAWKFGKKKKLELGVGARLSSFTSTGKYFITAPAKLVKGETGPGALFKEPIVENMDSVLFPSAQINALNFLLSIGYTFSKKFSAGFNIDAIGFSFGGSQSGTYINGSTTQAITASPTSFNLLLVGENDEGSLNSEFFVAYAFDKKWSAKLGFQHIFMEYTTDTQVQQFPEPNDRFRITPTIVCAGVSYRIH